MKLRIKGNSIRLRLTKTEIENFGENGYLIEKTEFINKEFIYELLTKHTDDGLSASFDENKITVYVPQKIKKQWTTSEIVGFENKMQTKNGKYLFLLIEKDFVCIDNTLEDQSDNYPNPNTVC